MNEKEAYDLMAQRLDMTEKQLQLLVELTLDLAVIDPIRPETLKRIGPVLDLRPGKKVLDLACGKAGVSLPLVFTYKVNLTGVDIMPDFIREAWSRAEYSGIYENCRFVLDDAASFVKKVGGKWDAVLILGALPYVWPDLDEGLAALGNLVDPGGGIVVGMPYHRPDKEPYPDLELLTKDEMTERLSRLGEVAEILDDGEEGWEAYVAPQRTTATTLKEKNEGDAEAVSFIDEWLARAEWEKQNVGFAVWIVKRAG